MSLMGNKTRALHSGAFPCKMKYCSGIALFRKIHVTEETKYSSSQNQLQLKYFVYFYPFVRFGVYIAVTCTCTCLYNFSHCQRKHNPNALHVKKYSFILLIQLNSLRIQTIRVDYLEVQIRFIYNIIKTIVIIYLLVVNYCCCFLYTLT